MRVETTRYDHSGTVHPLTIGEMAGSNSTIVAESIFIRLQRLVFLSRYYKRGWFGGINCGQI